MRVLAVNIKDIFEPAQKFNTIGELISTLLPNVYMLAGLLLFILLLAGGFGLIMGAGGDDPKKAETGKKAVTAALIGFLIIFTSYWIIQIIEVLTGVNILKSGL